MSHKRSKAARKAVPQVQFDPKVMEALVPGPLTAEETNRLFGGFKKAVFERALGAEMSQHLGSRPGEPRPGARAIIALGPPPRR
jgi:putative transposase